MAFQVPLYVTSSLSVLHKAVPEKKGFVRGRATLGGWAVKPISDEPPVCGVTWLSMTDPNGNLPKA